MTDADCRLRVRVRGVVQGVGFRPFAHGLAVDLGVAGWVTNDGAGVLAEIEGDRAALTAFVTGVRARAPAAALVQGVETSDVAPTGERGFRIVPGTRSAGTRTLVAPDAATCSECLREMRDPGNRRHRHAFISCTECGPRYTIITGLPYDRSRTTMAGFPLCPACQAEYEDPADRRFHAEPICCPDCGPRLRLLEPGGGHLAEAEPALAQVRRLLAAGGVVAIKGLGGFHLACDAADENAVARLRRGKGRAAKPFAVMPGDLRGARSLVDLSPTEETLLAARQAPIVLAPRLSRAAVAEAVAPAAPWLGVLLPYTPLHHLLLEPGGPGGPAPAVLVMTSGNLSEEPIAFEDADALARLGPLVDALLTHDRAIAAPCDDSVVRVHSGGVLPLRRSRGHAPLPVSLPVAVHAPVLAVGGELKAAVAVAVDSEAFVGPHVGDAGDPSTLDALERCCAHMTGLLDASPAALACDAHPGYRSARWAHSRAAGRPLHRVAHHHAHAAAVMAENGVDPNAEVIAVTFDGSGHGDDGTVWGGEVLIASYRGFRRAAHLAPVPLPGGELAIRRPARMALAHLWAAGVPWEADLAPVAALDARERAVVLHQIRTGLNSPLTTSAGRLFDAVASLVAVCHETRYEGEAAMALEGLAGDRDAAPYPVELDDGEPAVIAAAPVIAGVVRDLRAGEAPEGVAARLHVTVAMMALEAVRRAAASKDLTTAALSGGVFQNVRLLNLTARLLEDDGFDVLTHRLVPPGDGGLALGQAAIASAAGA